MFLLGILVGVVAVICLRKASKFHKDWIVEQTVELSKYEGPYRSIPVEHVQHRWAENVDLKVRYPSGQWPEVLEVVEDFHLSHAPTEGPTPTFEVNHVTGHVRVRYCAKAEVDRSTGCLVVNRQAKPEN